MENNIFDTKKLEFYLQHADKGFILLTVNEVPRQNRLFELISTFCPMAVFNLKDTSFRSTLLDLNEKTEVKTVVYYNFNLPTDELRDILEKINLSRDLLLEYHKLFIFIVPSYIEKLIQEDFPNLYSYFILKENYVKHHEVFFEYILPGSNYLVTREAQHEFKRHYISNAADLNERLNYFSHAKISKKDLKILIQDVDLFTREILEKNIHYDTFYLHKINLKLADVLFAQAEYEQALLRYKDIFYSVGHSISSLYCDSVLGIGDCCYSTNEYTDAIFYYNHLMSMLAMQNDSVDIFNKYSKKVYSRIALCYAKFNDMDNAQKYMDKAIHLITDTDAFSKIQFELYFNYILFQLQTASFSNYKMRDTLEKLKESALTIVQTAMYLTVSGWYYGIVEGDLKHGERESLEALNIKSNYFIENDLRIAESHYAIAVIHLFSGNYKEARHCYQKCTNILKNFDLRHKQKKLLEALLTDIQSQTFTG